MVTLDDLTAIEKQAYSLMIAARDTPRYDLYAKVWMNADRDLRKAKAAAKKKPTVETPSIAPAPEPEAKDTTPKRGLKA